MVQCLFLLLAILVSFSHGRGWGFSKDTVYEMSDSVEVWNQTKDTVRIDSILLFDPKPRTHYPELLEIRYYTPLPNMDGNYWAPTHGVPYLSSRTPFIPRLSTIKLSDFVVYYFNSATSARSLASNKDTISITMVFYSEMERDTLVFKGLIDTSANPSHLRTFPTRSKSQQGSDDEYSDALGRQSPSKDTRLPLTDKKRRSQPLFNLP